MHGHALPVCALPVCMSGNQQIIHLQFELLSKVAGIKKGRGRARFTRAVTMSVGVRSALLKRPAINSAILVSGAALPIPTAPLHPPQHVIMQ